MSFETGVDVSHYQGLIDWAKVRATNQFAFIKCTDGVSAVDVKFEHNWRYCSIFKGAYHYFRCDASGTAQGEHFSKTLMAAGFSGADLPPVIDIEDRPGAATVGKAGVLKGVHQWVEAVSSYTKRIPIVYCDPSFAAEYLDDTLSGCFLWIAETGVTAPKIPKGWTGWHFWQHTFNGKVNGISTQCDLDYYNGTAADIPLFIEKSIIR